MKITCETMNKVLVARLSGSVDASARSEFGETKVLKSRATDLVVDLAGVDFMDSAGLGGLVMLIKSYREAGRKCLLASPSPLVSKILKITAIHQLAPVEASVEKAVSSLKG